MILDANFLEDIQQHVEELFRIHHSDSLVYHNLEHTKNVVNHTKELSEHCIVSTQMQNELIAAAWFHDTGHLVGDMHMHEENSVRLMISFLNSRKIQTEIINNIADIILATKISDQPENICQFIIRDADTYHLGTRDFRRIDALVWKELELRTSVIIQNRLEKSIKFLENHRFYTPYCIEKLSDGKNENLIFLKDELNII